MPHTIQSIPPISPPVTQLQVINMIRHDPNTSRSLAYFLSLASSTIFNHTPLTYQAMIKTLCQSFQLDTAQYLLQQMTLEKISCTEETMICLIQAYSQTGSVMQALKTFYRANELGCSITVRVYNHLFDALLKDNRFSMIGPLYSDMKKDGIEPNVYTYNILIKALCRNNRVEAALKLLEEMPKKGALPDEVSLTTVVSSLCGMGRISEAKNMLVKLPPLVSCYNALIHGLCGSFRLKEVFEMFHKMSERGLLPNVITYTTIIGAFCNAGDLAIACAILVGDVHGAMNVWHMMGCNGCKPNVVAYTCMVDAYCKSKMFDDAYDMIMTMKMEQNCQPNTATYNTLIKGLCENGQVGRAMRLLAEMRRSGCILSTRTYNILLDGLFKEGEHREAFKLFNEMLDSNSEMDTVTFNTVVHGLCALGFVQRALALLGKMIVNGLGPNLLTFNPIVHSYCKDNNVRKAAHILGAMGARDVTAYTMLISGLCGVNRLDCATVYLLKMWHEGIIPNYATWSTLVRAVFVKFGRLGSVQLVQDLLDEFG
ncbi:hypothetical protein LUZ63_019881 [Rhynchospora breviuscula]|uniref:Pentatricopeptide repeat-containing protein n=1 Tax=Rhynchospora breviuscula TaxID=2022672 RepID=A0A9Q0C710_9POAL|nr:hypothetical protein LUZ63_019881 [Rhynchospora breviuscula]